MGPISRYLTISTPRQAVVVTFDDALTTEYTEGFTYMHSLGLKGTIYVITSKIDVAGYMTADQLAEVYAAGWDLGNHTHEHTYAIAAGLSQAQYENQLVACQEALDALGFTRASRHVAYPGGENNADVWAAMTATDMLTGRTISPGNFYLPGIDRQRINGTNFNNTVSLATAKGYVDDALANEKICCLLFHGLVENNALGSQWLIADFQALIDYIAASSIRVSTISELAQRVI